MPIFEYTCGSCDHDFEALIRGGEQAECPQCGGRQLVKQFSVPAAHSASANSLPICGAPSAGTCGMPDCGSNGCPFE